MFRCLPPAGHKIGFTEICRSLFQSPNIELFNKNIGLTVPYFLVDSGTAALCLSLQALGTGSSRKEVILPAYTCPSLLAAIVKAGLDPVLCDLKPNTFQLNLDQLSSKLGEKTLSVIAVHLLGIPEDIAEIKKRTEAKGIILIEDAAQAFGNSLSLKVLSNRSVLSGPSCESRVGSLGDIGILSFGRGKPLSLLGGGAVLVNNKELQARLKSRYDLAVKPSLFFSPLSHITKLIFYSIFFHPFFFRIPASMPGLKIGETRFLLDFSIGRGNPLIIRIGNTIAARFKEIRKVRLSLERSYRDFLSRYGEEFAYLPESDENDDRIALLRFPIIFKKRERRDRILEKLKAKGLGATGMYPAPLDEIKDTSGYLEKGMEFPEAKSVSERILTLPLHEYVTNRDIQKMVRVFEMK